MTTGKGGFLVYFEPERSQLFQERANADDNFSVELSRLDNSPKAREFFLVCFDGEGKRIGAAAMASYKRGPQNTGARNYRFSDFVFFEPISIGQLERSLTARARSALIKSSGGVARRIPPVTWMEVRQAIATLRPAEASALEALWQKVCQPERIDTERSLQTLALQRDAIGLALDCAKLEERRRELFRKSKAVVPSARKDSFIAYLEETVRTQERELIEYDRAAFQSLALPNFSVSGELSIDGSGRRLYVRTLDKGPLETSLGVDLLIYLSDLASLVMVQYKCCEHKNSEWTYRPDGGFDVQMESMRQAEVEFEKLRQQRLEGHLSPVEQMRNSRLCAGPFYVKFCKRLPLLRQDGELSEGRLLRRADLAALLMLEQSRGKRDGRLVKYDSIPRYMSNSDFAGLVSGGWIGTSHLTQEELAETVVRLTENSSRVVLAEAQRRR